MYPRVPHWSLRFTKLLQQECSAVCLQIKFSLSVLITCKGLNHCKASGVDCLVFCLSFKKIHGRKNGKILEELNVTVPINNIYFTQLSLFVPFFIDRERILPWLQESKKKKNSRALDVRLLFEFASNCNEYSVFIVSLYRELFKFRFVTTHAWLVCTALPTTYIDTSICVLELMYVKMYSVYLIDRLKMVSAFIPCTGIQALFVVTKLQ